ncbi:hypothetical protein AB0C13_29330 [Streptomyces sp. NPDC049099]|uniref:hypothetical protein n=1 Tax=Streptomyces sp. NPDC049099 TaxID=3155768 RepID=UPI00343B371B
MVERANNRGRPGESRKQDLELGAVNGELADAEEVVGGPGGRTAEEVVGGPGGRTAEEDRQPVHAAEADGDRLFPLSRAGRARAGRTAQRRPRGR